MPQQSQQSAEQTLRLYQKLLIALWYLASEQRPIPDLSEEQWEILAAISKRPYFKDRSCTLTAREGETCFWLAAGKSCEEIGIILGISPRTVEKHRDKLYAKLAVSTRAELTDWWLTTGR